MLPHSFNAGRHSVFDVRAKQRQIPPKHRGLLNADSPLAVHNYFDGQEPCDLVTVAQWAIDHHQQKLLQQLQADGFQGPVPVSDLYRASKLYEMAGPGLAVELELLHEINPGNVDELIAFLDRPDVKVTGLWLNLSFKGDAKPLGRLLSAVDALPNLEVLKIEVDGQSEGPVTPDVRLALANSKACMDLSGAARSLILIQHQLGSSILNRIQDDAVRTFFLAKEKKEAANDLLGHAEVMQKEAEALPTGLERSQYEERATSAQCTARKVRLIAEDLHANAVAKRGARRALAAFLGMENCPATGNRIPHAFVDILVRLACSWNEDGLLCAVRLLAPDYVMTFRVWEPSRASIDLLATCRVPCHLEFAIDQATIGDLTHSIDKLRALSD